MNKAGQSLLLLTLVLSTPLMAGKSNMEVEIYGKLHASVDVVDDGENDNTNVSSNSSRIGFRGSKHLIRDLKGLWQLESTVVVDGESGSLDVRNRYVGINGGIGTLLVGVHDTPFKSLARSVDIFNETIGDNRNLLGATASDGNSKLFNVRARNAIFYKSPKTNGIMFQALYSTDYAGDDTVAEANRTLSSVSVTYDSGPLYLGVAYEDRWKNAGYRLLARVKSETAFASFIFESLQSMHGVGGMPEDRNAYGFNAAYHIGLISLALQYIVTDKYEDTEDSGGNMVALGVFQSLSKSTRLYLVAANANNGTNAQFGLGGGGHGDPVLPYNDPVTGRNDQDSTAISFGMIHKF